MDALKPVEGEDEVEELVRSWCSSCGLVVDVYWPGRRMTLEGTLDDDSTVPMVVLENPWIHCPAEQTTIELVELVDMGAA